MESTGEWIVAVCSLELTKLLIVWLAPKPASFASYFVLLSAACYHLVKLAATKRSQSTPPQLATKSLTFNPPIAPFSQGCR